MDAPIHLDTFAALAGISAVALLVIDLTWLGLVAGRFYRRELGSLLRAKPDPVAAGAFYVLFVLGLTYFVTRHAVARESVGCAACRGAAYGLVTYGTYDLTNRSVLEGYGWRIALVDLAWGTAL